MTKIFLVFLVIFSLFKLNLDSKQLLHPEISLFQQKLEIKNLDEFFIFLKQICSSQILLKNLKKHSSYPKFGSANNWKKVCKKLIDDSLDKKSFLKKNFKLASIHKTSGLLTGYYEPIIEVSRTKKNDYNFPILKFNKKFIGSPRKSIISDYNENDVLLWTNNKIDLFFLQIQGSGIGVFPDKKKIKILYSGNNGKEYSSIGKLLVERDLIKKKNVSLFSIKEYLRNNKNQIDDIFNHNERYIFFDVKEYNKKSAYGALGINLRPGTSIAIDKKYYPLGLPFLAQTINNGRVFLGIASDTGSAIIGPNRADLFTGRGKMAEKKAGDLKKKLILHVLVPYSN